MTTRSLGRFLFAVLAGACLFVACETHQKPPLLGASSGLYVAPQSVGSLTSSIQWTKGTSAPTLSQATQTTDTAPPDLLIQSGAPYASAVTNLVGGNIDLNIPAPVSGTAMGAVKIESGGTAVAFLQAYPGSTSYGGMWPGGLVASSTNYAFLSQTNGTNTYVNTVTGGTDIIAVNGSQQVGVTTSAVTVGPALNLLGGLGGSGSTPLKWIGQTSPNTVACGTGGTQTISAGQAIIPFFIVTGSGLTSNCTLDFSTNASTGHFEVGTSGLTLGATFGLVIKNGTTSSTTFTTANAVAGSTMAIVNTYGTNNLAVNF